MSKKVGGVLLSFALMAPCVFCVGAPALFLAASVYRQQREFQQAYPDSVSSISFGSLTVNGDGRAGYIFAGAAIILFIIGLVLLFRNFTGKSDLENASDDEN